MYIQRWKSERTKVREREREVLCVFTNSLGTLFFFFLIPLYTLPTLSRYLIWAYRFISVWGLFFSQPCKLTRDTFSLLLLFISSENSIIQGRPLLHSHRVREFREYDRVWIVKTYWGNSCFFFSITLVEMRRNFNINLGRKWSVNME